MSLKQTFTQADIVSVAAGDTFNVDSLDELGVQLTAPVAWGAVTVAFQASLDGTNWESCAGVASSSTARGTGVVSTTTVGLWVFDVCNYLYFRINVTARASGTVRAVITGNRRNSN